MTSVLEIQRLFRVLLLFLLVFAQVVPSVAQAAKTKPDSSDARLSYVTANNGFIKLKLSPAPKEAPSSQDFQLSQRINGKDAGSVAIDTFSYDEEERTAYATFAPLESTEKKQSVVISVNYNGSQKSSRAFTIASKDAEVKSLSILNPSATNELEVGHSLSLVAIAKDEDNNVVANADIEWTSSNSKVLTVDDTGLVKAKKAGSASVTAYAGNAKASFRIEAVEGPSGAAGVSATNGAVTVQFNGAMEKAPTAGDFIFRAVIDDSKERALSITAYHWSESTNAASFRFNPLTPSTSKDQKVTILVMYGNKTLKADPFILASRKAKVASVEVMNLAEDAELVLGTDDISLSLVAIAKDKDGNTISGKRFSWSTSDKRVATVDRTGNVTARGVGNAVITAEVDNVSGSLGVTVKKQQIPDDPPPPVLTGSLAGYVYGTDWFNQFPLADVRVEVMGTTFAAVTNAQGSFTIPNLPQASYQLRFQASQPGYTETISGSYTVVAGQTTTIAPVKLTPTTGSILGMVTDPTGLPIAGASVTVTGQGVSYDLITDAEGKYRQTNIPYSDDPITWLNMEVKKEGFQTATLSIPLTKGALTSVPTLTLIPVVVPEKPGHITGQVKGANGLETYPLAGVTVEVMGTDLYTVSDQQGMFTISNVAAGTYTLRYIGEAVGHENLVTLPYQVKAGETFTLDPQVLYTASGIVTGRVIEVTGEPIGNADVVILGNGYQQTVTSDVYGNYRFDQVPQVATGDLLTYTISAGKEGYQQNSVTVAPTRGGVITADAIVLSKVAAPTGSLTGKLLGVYGNGAIPLAGVPVQLVGTTYSTVTDATGTYLFTDVPEGEYQIFLQAEAIGYANITWGPFSVTAGKTTDVGGVLTYYLESGTVNGLVQNSSGKPVAGATVTIFGNSYSHSVTTDVYGLYRIDFVPQTSKGDKLIYSLQASKEGYLSAATTVSPIIGSVVDVPALVLQQLITDPFDQNEGGYGGYQNGAYQPDAAQPTIFNWTRQSRYTVTEKPSLKWKYQLEGYNQAVQDASTIVDRDGVTYLGATNTGDIYAITPEGKLKWRYQTDYVIGDVTLGQDGTIYAVTGDSYLLALKDGKLKWSLKLQGSFSPAPIIGADGTIYVGSATGYLYAVNPDGTIKWKTLLVDSLTSWTANYVDLAMGSDGVIYAAIQNKVYAISYTGQVMWSYATGALISGITLRADGTIFVGSNDKKLYAIDIDGTLQWTYTLTSHIDSLVAIAADGTLYFGAGDANLYALTPSGAKKWTFQAGGNVYSTPVIDASGVVWFGSTDGSVYGVNPNGTLKWSYALGDRTLSSPSIDKDGSLIIAADDNAIYRFGQ
ncbi:carboxypeptidase regulatory-like domain-containing protein [Brevibacillus dissolubilis]|uniref:carboxypeptidase regulatory-like domain-containing protein n=1 Tax=Brevibacillus dissolubilis TaxID=1844116 RepID=UPI0011173DF1|nr:carboxypeptidase regulatory-like domain-containing protein [Brevibacillus dissolubilis]